MDWVKVKEGRTSITTEEEEILWKKGNLGCSNPRALVDTILYMSGLYFALRSGGEHRQPRFHQCQIELIEQPGERACLKYTEDIPKNHPGGLKHTSDHQLQHLSDILTGSCGAVTPTSTDLSIQPVTQDNTGDISVHNSSSKHLTMNFTQTPSFNIQGCMVTINNITHTASS